jgi:hypothetical protein
MRYPQGGGLTPERQAFGERIRLGAAERFAAGASNAEVAKDLRVSVRSVRHRRRAWHDAGTERLRSAVPGPPPQDLAPALGGDGQNHMDRPVGHPPSRILVLSTIL